MIQETIGVCALAILFFMTVQFAIALAIKNNSIVDIGWGFGFVIVALVSFGMNKNFSATAILASAITILWGLRLGVYLFIRNRNKPEDWRYAKWRKEWGNKVVIRSFFQVFMLQGVILLINSLPVMVANSASVKGVGISMFHVIGFSLWFFGFLFEAIADFQLFVFKQKPENKGKIITTGLWRFSRHPNYFGEAVLQWGIWLVCVPAGFVYFTIIAPVLITYLLVKVSGVAMLEKKYKGNREYENYMKHTNAFFPSFSSMRRS